MQHARRNISLLIIAQLIFVSGSVITLTFGGIVGAKLAPTANLATLPVSLMVLGTAIGTLPASWLMNLFGRQIGFIGAALAASFSLWLAADSIAQTRFWQYCIATSLIGVCLAFSAQLRFAAAESVDLSRAGLAISLILAGSIWGAIVGPELITQGSAVNEDGFIGALLLAAVLFLIGAAVLLFLKLPRPSDQVAVNSVMASMSVLGLLQSPQFLLAVISGTVGYGVMTYLMTATPVSMHVIDGHSMEDTAAVIRAHVLGMYVPSLFSGYLITRYGERNIIGWGVAIYVITIAIALTGQAVMHYTAALILLGLGWNFMFVGGTTLLIKTYQPEERFKAQAINEAAVFGTSAVGSLLAGALLSQFGWTLVVISTVPALLLVTVLMVLTPTHSVGTQKS